MLFKLVRKNTSFPLSIFIQLNNFPVTICMCSLPYRYALISVKKYENTDRNSFTPLSMCVTERIFANHTCLINFCREFLRRIL